MNNPTLSRRKQLREALLDALCAPDGALEGRRIVVEACTLARAHKIRLHLPEQRSTPVMLITTDLDDPMPAWRETRDGRRRADAILWRSAADIADGHPAVTVALARCVMVMNRKETQASPRLSAVLPVLLKFFDRKARTGRDGWVWRKGDAFYGVLKGVHCGTHEAFELRLTGQGVDRWPQIAERLDATDDGDRYARRVVWTPDEVLAIASKPDT
jgi:hypothetical protein